MKKKKLAVFGLAVLLGMSFALFPLPVTVHAANMIYVQTGVGTSGDGTEAAPYDDFKTAYRNATAGDTIILVNTVTIQNDDNGSDKGVFTFNKAIRLQGNGTDIDGINDSGLSSRVPVQLEADVTMGQAEFFAPKVYLNGHALSMNEVKTNANNSLRVNVYGGSYQGTAQSGNQSSLDVTGFVSSPFEFDNIYAGAETGLSSIPVSVTLNSGAKVLRTMDASGGDAKVDAAVDFVIGNANVPTLKNTYGTANSALHFKNYTNQGSPVIDGYHNVKLENSTIREDSASFTAISGKLELLGNSILDLRGGAVFTADELYSETGCRIILNKDNGQMKVGNAFTGALEMRTPGADVNTSGFANLDWPYIEAGLNSTGIVEFRPFFTQDNVEMQEITGAVKQWVVKEKNPGNPAYSIVFDGNGGDGSMAVQSAASGSAVPLDKNQFTKEGHAFLGWAITADGNVVYTDGQNVSDIASPGGTVTLYAVWEISRYDVRFDSQGGSPVDTQNVEYDGFVKEPASPTKDGQIFGGWYTDTAYQNAWDFQIGRMPARDLVLYAKWDPDVPGENTLPTIHAADKTVMVGDAFDPLQDVMASDKEDGDITKNIEVIKNDVDTSKAGTYEVSYQVSDKDGGTVAKTIQVIVKEKPENTSGVEVTDETGDQVKIDPSGLDVGRICRENGIDPTGRTVAIVISQKAAAQEDSSKLEQFAKEQGASVKAVYEILMSLYVDGEELIKITEGFGTLKADLYAGKEYAGQKADVYQLHRGTEVIVHDGLQVDQDGVVTITVDKLSAFAVSMKETGTGGSEMPGGDQTPSPNNPNGSSEPSDANNPNNGGGANGNSTKADSANGNGTKTDSANGNSVKTGDQTNIGWYLSILAISGLLIAVLVAGKKAYGRR